jgi:allophanate hydrolase
VALGSIQVLDKGLFIINLVDRQTVGGYPKIATIVGSDVRDLAQTLPGTKLRFEAVDIAVAQASFRERSLFIQHLERHMRPADPEDLTSEELLEVNLISGVCFGDQI